MIGLFRRAAEARRAVDRAAIEGLSRALWRGELTPAQTARRVRTLMRAGLQAGPVARVLGEAAQRQAAQAGEALIAAPDRALQAIQALERLGGRPFALIGDSHSRLLVARGSLAEGRFLVPIHRLCTGGSARGLGAAASRSAHGEAASAFVECARSLRPDLTVAFQFGQVDVEFVHTFQRLAAGSHPFDDAAFELFCTESADRYFAYLTGLRARVGGAPFLVVGVFPPALSDAAWRQGYINAHIAEQHGPDDNGGDGVATAAALQALPIPDLAERTEHHAAFNRLLRARAETAGIDFFDPLPLLLGAAGTADARFVGGAQGRDHHLEAGPVGGALLQPLSAALFS